MRSYWNRVDPSPSMTGVLVKRMPGEERHTQREDDVKTQRMRSTSQGMPRKARKPPEAWNTVPLQASGETNTAGALILGLQPPDLRDGTFLLF